MEKKKDVPLFLIEKLNKQYGEKITSKILNGYSQNRVVSLRVNTIKSHVVRVDQILNYIKNDINNYDRDLLAKQKDMKSCADFFVETNTNEYTSIAKKYEKYISNDKIEVTKEPEQKELPKDNKTLRDKLIELRTEKSKSMNVPAYYIFTNDELDKIIELNPISTEELKNAKILSDIKFKLHSSDIIKIICEFNKR